MAKKNRVTIGLAQFPATDIPKENITKTTAIINSLAQKGAQIICLQELFTTKYFCQTQNYEAFEFADSMDENFTNPFSLLAKKNNVVLVLPAFEKRAQGLYHNTALVIDADGSVMGKYRKIHIPDDPGFHEKFYFTPGDLGYKVFKTKYANIGVLICWDQWFPEAARLTALQDAQIIFYPTAIGWATSEVSQEVREAQQSAWITIQRSHAIANGVFVAAPNRVGTEDALRFWGNSFVANPFGKILHQADEEETEFVVECDLDQIDFYRQHWPFLRDRRIDTYSRIAEKYLD